MQSSPFASYPLGSIPPQATPGSSSYLSQQYGRPSGYPQPSFDNNPQLAQMMHQKQQALAHQQQAMLGGLGQAPSNMHPSQLAQMMQFQQQQQGQGGQPGYGSHPQMYAQPTPPQPQHHQQSHHQPSHHASSSHSRDQGGGGGDHHRSSKSSRRSKTGGANPAIFTIPVESEADPIGDDLDGVTGRTQAIERYKLNHDLFGQLFNPLPISKLPEPSSAPEPPYSISDLEARLAELEESNARLPEELASRLEEARGAFQSAATASM